MKITFEALELYVNLYIACIPLMSYASIKRNHVGCPERSPGDDSTIESIIKCIKGKRDTKTLSGYLIFDSPEQVIFTKNPGSEKAGILELDAEVELLIADGILQDEAFSLIAIEEPGNSFSMPIIIDTWHIQITALAETGFQKLQKVRI